MKLVLFTVLLSFPAFLLALPPQSFIDDVVKRHNRLRARHQVGPLRENREISLFAQEWADHLASIGRLEHRPNNKYGENLSFMPSSDAAGRQHVDLLYTEEERYYREKGYYNTEPNMNNFLNFGHFTQIVWKGSKEIGIGKAEGIVVINYNPPGNIIGEFEENVFPTTA